MSEAVGFIGLGVMGEPMCRNLARKCGRPVVAFDRRADPLEALAADGVETARSIAELVQRCDLVFLSLPGGPALEQVVLGEDALLANARAGLTVVDTTTAPVALTRQLADRCAERGLCYADAPVARTRAAAQAGTLSVMVGADAGLFARVEPLISCFAEEITHCGPVGSGQVVKLMNNMVLFQTVVALSEALTVATRAGVDGKVLFDTLAKGSADSFALRNHGMKALLPREFPERAFPTDYAAKDLAYAMALARDNGMALGGAAVAAELLERASALGHGERYFPALIEVIDGEP